MMLLASLNLNKKELYMWNNIDGDIVHYDKVIHKIWWNLIGHLM